MKFEVPFNLNWDGQYFKYLDKNKDKLKYIDCVYMPTLELDHNTREECLRKPIDEDTYANYIKELKSYDLNVSVLIQRDASMELIEKYINKYDIHDFTINDDELAKEIKSKYPDIKLRLSITRKVTPKELQEKDFSMYDVICLFFWYNKHLDTIKMLPKEYKYMLICNTECLWNCKNCDTHWFDIKNFRRTCIQERYKNGKPQYDKIAYIPPTELQLFENYIDVFKLEGREFLSHQIFKEFNKYINFYI